VGDQVRARLDADPAVYRLPVEDFEIYAVGEFFTRPECERLIAMVDAVARPSDSYSNDGGRTSYSGDVDPHDPFIRMLQRRIDDLMGIDPSFGETIQGQRYLPGQEFKAHFDHFRPSDPMWNEEMRNGGQRSWTAMAYLNTVEEGGSTDFPKVNLSIPPQPGALLIWNNMARDGRPNAKPACRAPGDQGRQIRADQVVSVPPVELTPGPRACPSPVPHCWSAASPLHAQDGTATTITAPASGSRSYGYPSSADQALDAFLAKDDAARRALDPVETLERGEPLSAERLAMLFTPALTAPTRAQRRCARCAGRSTAPALDPAHRISARAYAAVLDDEQVMLARRWQTCWR
jgi:prolyl 4-hydroxylase